MMEGPALANKKKYQSRLTEARKWRMELSTERDNDRSIFEHHLWQKVQQLCEQIQHIEQTSQQTVTEKKKSFTKTDYRMPLVAPPTGVYCT